MPRGDAPTAGDILRDRPSAAQELRMTPGIRRHIGVGWWDGSERYWYGEGLGALSSLIRIMEVERPGS